MSPGRCIGIIWYIYTYNDTYLIIMYKNVYVRYCIFLWISLQYVLVDSPNMCRRKLALCRTYSKIDWDRLQVIQHQQLPQVYFFSFPITTNKFQRPFPGCLGSSRTRSGLMNHFDRIHLQDIIHILEEHPTPYPHCKRCGRQPPPVDTEQPALHIGTVTPRQGYPA